VRRWSVVVLAVLGVVACGKGGDGVVVPATIEAVSGADGQSAPAGGLLPRPLAVTVRQADGSAAPRAQVRWTVTGGSGAVLSDSVTLADGEGQAQVTLRLGPQEGAYAVRAELVQVAGKLVAFGATATAPPVISAVVPAQFGGGDTITVRGSGFAADAAVDIASVPARVLAVEGDTTLLVTAPICLAAGSVAVQAWVRAAPTNVFGATYVAAAAPVRLAVGDYAIIDPTQVAGCARFPANTGTDTVKYLIAPQAATGGPGDTTTFDLTGDTALAAVMLAGASSTTLPFAMWFDAHLRELEAGYAELPRPAITPRPQLAPAAAPSVGSQRTFHVCDVVTCSGTQDFAQVTATLRYVGQHAAIYVDSAAPGGGFTDQNLQALGQLFDSDLYGVDTRAFGAESDVDNNGLVFILFTPAVNKLTPKTQCSQSFITGFFFNADIDPGFKGDSRSNQAEVFYAIVPDPRGTVSCTFGTSDVTRLVPVTFIHEFQHMISYYHHVLLGGGSTEALWLNEGMSHLAEELGGWHFLAQGDTSRFSDFVLGDLYNAYHYLLNPDAYATLFGSGTGTLEERGGAWLFLRWLVDQYGDASQNDYDITRRLAETPLRGAANVEAATGDSIGQLLPQWFLANYVSDLPGFTPPGRLSYTSWSFRKTYASLNQQSPNNFSRPFPLVPQTASGGMFDVSGVLRSGSGAYVLAVQTPAQPGFGLRFTDGGGGALPDSLHARLNVIRIR
jgi:IPT/TIG domain